MLTIMGWTTCSLKVSLSNRTVIKELDDIEERNEDESYGISDRRYI